MKAIASALVSRWRGDAVIGTVARLAVDRLHQAVR